MVAGDFANADTLLQHGERVVEVGWVAAEAVTGFVPARNPGLVAGVALDALGGLGVNNHVALERLVIETTELVGAGLVPN